MGLDKKEPGDRLVWTAEVYNRWARAANAMMRAGADQHFGMTVGPHGRQIAREAEGFWAKLSGAGPTYTAVEQLRDPATTAWVDGPRALTGVVEVNAVVGLAGTVQFVEPSTSPGEWLFQAVRLGGAACAATLTVTVTDNCSGAVLSGVALTASLTGQSNVTGTTNVSGVATLTVPAAGTWSIQGVKSGYTTASVSGVAVCGSTTNVSLKLVVTGQVTSRTVQVKGCAGQLLGAGVTVNLIQGGVTVATGVTNSSSNVVFANLSALTYTAQAVAPLARYTTTSSPAFAVTCGTTTPTVVVTLTAASGYNCGAGDGTPCAPRPVATTLFLTDPVLGSVTLTWSGSDWFGTVNVTQPNVRDAGCANAANRNVTVKYSLIPTNLAGSPAKNTQWSLTVFKTYCVSAFVRFMIQDDMGGAGDDQVTGTTSSGGCPADGAVTIPVSFAGGSANVLQAIYGTGTRNFTFSE